ncbi:uncharacterized protein K452DRAFT_262052 [Aplosporella prunicola CBS 121167]|uniref:C2H2-type domain-containing protein n=1 Tax=Aplosporella prunicola CBS 121167 TaxID=1176127 RepID=A0A6A6BTR6_9PEZI|nr:uncharacterized protein K452DRAFT_262052 [Aplosporella prunicola CBS 121167]KAF2147512.1 hypothetical protein K452DRAFT_262052 [Aplosporella prunicola CBS 121167]
MTSSIFDDCERCLLSFEQLLSLMQEPLRDYGDQLPRTGIIDEFDRFKVWTGSLGADRPPHKRNSLDFRLRDSKFYRDQVSAFLSDLSSTIQKAIQLLRNERLPNEERPFSLESDLDSGLMEIASTSPDPMEIDSTSSDSTGTEKQEELEAVALANLRAVVGNHRSPQPFHKQPHDAGTADEGASDAPSREMVQLYQGIQELTKHLYRLSMIIHRPIPVDRVVVSSKIPVDHFEFFDLQHVNDCFPNADEKLKCRLAKAITRRRQLLAYNKQRHGERVEIMEQQRTAAHMGDRTPHPYMARTSIIDESKLPDMAMKPTLTAVEKTTLRPVITDANVDILSEDESVASATTSKSLRDRFSLLRRPLDPNGKEMKRFYCPYCFHAIEARNNRIWRKHIFKDLQAYVCTFKNCEQADRMFETKNEWYKHELDFHWKEWHCNNEKHPVYQTRNEFETHIRCDHAQEADKGHLPLLVDICARPVLSGEVACPLCAENQHENPKRFMRHRKTVHFKTSDLSPSPPTEFLETQFWDEENQKDANLPPTAENYSFGFSQETSPWDKGKQKDANLPSMEIKLFDAAQAVSQINITNWMASLPHVYQLPPEARERSPPSTPISSLQPHKMFLIEASKMKHHLAEHMERLALFAILPSKESDKDATVSISNASNRAFPRESLVDSEFRTEAGFDEVAFGELGFANSSSWTTIESTWAAGLETQRRLPPFDTASLSFDPSSLPSFNTANLPPELKTCHQCGQSFSNIASLGNHAASTGHAAFVCSENGCELSFSRFDVLRRHQKSHLSGTARFPCKYCKKHRGADSFKREEHLMQHLRNYHHTGMDESSGIRRSCPHKDCSESRPNIPDNDTSDNKHAFQKFSDYISHMRKVHNESDFPCTEHGCDHVGPKGYFRKRDLLKHKAKEHGIPID